MVLALKNLSKGTFADKFIQFESVADLVATDYAIVALAIIEAIIYKAL